MLIISDKRPMQSIEACARYLTNLACYLIYMLLNIAN